MAKVKAIETRRAEREKREGRDDFQPKIVVRITPAEQTRLRAEAGEAGVSAYVRARVFDGAFSYRVTLRKIAALHHLGRQLQRLVDDGVVDEQSIAETLDEVRGAIADLVREKPEDPAP